jgi:zinc/manganese transport system permease protein
MFAELLIDPFLDFAFMRRALIACIALALGCGPVGTLLILRRMSLVGDAMSHAVLPGAAVGFLFAGLSLWAMGLGGFAAGILVALTAGFVTRATGQREDASFAAFYLISLAIGVMIVSSRGSNVDLIHVLFGTVLAVDDAALLLVAAIASITLITLAVVYRPLLVECFDPGFLKAIGSRGAIYHSIFLVLVVLNLVAGFQALGTLMAVGLMMLPAAAAKFWARSIIGLALGSILIAMMSGYVGLVLSFHLDLQSGPAIILAAGGFYILSLIAGPKDGLLRRFFPVRHLRA